MSSKLSISNDKLPSNPTKEDYEKLRWVSVGEINASINKQKIIALIAELGAAYGAIFGDECLDTVAQEIININQNASGSGA